MRILLFIFILLVNINASKIIKINLSTQKLYAIEDQKVIFSSKISSGKLDKLTPRGVFRIIEKDRYHISNKYPEPNGGAKMPYMLRLSKSGLAIHQGYLPGFPASHGCIRVPKNSAIKLWKWAKIGTVVKIYGDTRDFKYVKKVYKKSKKYTKRKYKRKRRYYSKKYRKLKRRRYIKKRYYPKRYTQTTRYKIIELYDDY